MIELSNDVETSNPIYTHQRKIARHVARIELLEDAFERLYSDKPIILPTGSAITKVNVALEAGLPKTAVCDRQKYQQKLISKINFVQAIHVMNEESKGVVEKVRVRNPRQQETLRNLYHALNRLIDDEPLNVPKGSIINQSNVAIEAGYKATKISTRNPLFTEICADIRKAKQEKELHTKGIKAASHVITLSECTTLLRQALGRVESNTTRLLKPNSPITMQNVSIEAGLDKDFLKNHQKAFKSFILKIEDKEIKRQAAEFQDALDRLLLNEPKRLERKGLKISIYSVALEAGYPKNYLKCYKALFANVVNAINEAAEESNNTKIMGIILPI